MGLYLIIVGALLVVGAAAALLMIKRPAPQDRAGHPAEPKPPISKAMLVVMGCLLILVGIPMVFSSAILLSPLPIIGGIWLIKLSRDVDQRHAENMQARAKAEQAHTMVETARIQTENARREAERQAQLNLLRDAAERERLEAERLSHIQRQRDITYQETLRPVAQEHGIDIQNVIALNVQKVQAQLELEKKLGFDRLDNQKRWEQIQQNLNAINLVKLAGSEQMRQLTTMLIQEVDNLVRVESYQWPEEQKDIVRGQIKRNITFYQEQINGLHTNSRFGQGSAGQKPGGLGEGTANPRSDYPPGDFDG